MIIGIEVYDRDVIRKICEHPQIDGVVIGDLYCQKRMFENGIYDMFAYIDILKSCGEKVIFQTPRYITDRNMEEEIEKVRFLVENKQIDAVIVQDIGVAAEIAEILPDLELIWGKMGYNRNPVANRSFFEFLKQYRVYSVETADPKRKQVFQAMGLNVYTMVGDLKYQSVNRECYYLYQNDIFDKKCDRGCLKRKQELVQVNGRIQMTVDGYMLGRRYDYSRMPESEDEWKNSILYGRDYKEILQYIKIS
ncbi:MAG: hypothetical protein U0L05_06595 [Schaedlerella sp.]|nr:hypothetical protein [Schaedlerella sp.]